MIQFITQINYIGEELFWGDLGHFFVLLAFVAAILGAISFYFGTTSKEVVDKENWSSLGRKAFWTHGVAVIGIITVLFCMLFFHRYEYYYVWKHSSNELPLRFIFSCFWEGQEGSFLLWFFWHAVLGTIVMKISKDWQAPVMAIFCLVQVFLGSMLLGLYFELPEFLGGEIQIGSSPFMQLLREHADFVNSPIFLQENYLEKIDGNGLNPLLQNYWMTIHPPILFLGFASTLVPFAFAIAGLWTKRFNEWMEPVIPWIFFGVMILGTGILMGGAWAYEALSFGGFWAWDPVENASLMPWLTFVAAAHIMMVQKKKGESSYISFVLTILSFLFVLYSTYLTRSGILGDTSVHSFAGGLPGQLIVFMGVFFLISCYLLIQNKLFGAVFIAFNFLGYYLLYLIPDDQILFSGITTDLVLKVVFGLGMVGILIMGYKNFFPRKEGEEEALASREFWIFIGALVLMLSAIQIIFSTSLPVFNELFGTDKVLGEDPILHYNKRQLPIAILIGILVGFTQFLKYKKTDTKKFWKNISLSAVLALAGAIILTITLDYKEWSPTDTGYTYFMWMFPLMLFSTLFAFFGNLEYFRKILKGNVKAAGGSISHIGFSLILFGAFISTSNRNVISQNTSSVDIENLAKELTNDDNILLTKNDTLPMGDYYVTFQKKWKEGIYVNFNIDYLKKVDGEYVKEFTLNPNVQTNIKKGNVAEPGTRHMLHKDIYTHVQWANLDTTVLNPNEYDKGTIHKFQKGDTITTSKYMFILEKINKNIDRARYGLKAGDLAIGATLKIVDSKMEAHYAYPIFVLRKNGIQTTEERIEELGLIVQFPAIDPSTETFSFKVFQQNGKKQDFIILKAIEFPLINVLWLGCIVMIIGTTISVISRVKTLRRKSAA